MRARAHAAGSREIEKTGSESLQKVSFVELKMGAWTHPPTTHREGRKKEKPVTPASSFSPLMPYPFLSDVDLRGKPETPLRATGNLTAQRGRYSV